MNELINENLSDFELLSEDVKNVEKAFERFLGYANTYGEGRPKLPSKAIELLKIYIEELNISDDRLYKIFKGQILCYLFI